MDFSSIVQIVSKMTSEPDVELVQLYVDQAASEVLNFRYPFGYSEIDEGITDDFLVKHTQTIVKIAVFLLNKRGAEGQTSHNEGGVSRGYDSGDIPPGYYKGITPMTKVVGGATDETITP